MPSQHDRNNVGDETATPHESSPLLRDNFFNNNEHHTSQHEAINTTDVSPVAKQSTHVLAVVCILLLLLDNANFLAVAPQAKILEDIICNNYYSHLANNSYGDTLPTDERCKIEPIQSQMAFIIGWTETLQQLPGLFLGIAYGLLADRIGRRPVLLLSMLGLVLSDSWVKVVCWFPQIFPVQMIYLSAPILIFGGGAQVAGSMLFVMLADSYSREERATSFFYFSAAVPIAEIVAMPISGATMVVNPWIPFLGSSAVEFIAIIVAFLITPETLLMVEIPSESLPSIINSENTAPADKTKSFTRALADEIWDNLKNTKKSTHFVWDNLNTSLVLLVFFVASLSRQSMGLLLQYATKKYHWSYSKAAFLISIRGVASFAAVLIILPILSRLLLKRAGFEAATKDLWLSRGTAFFLTLGTFIMFLAPTPPVLIFGIVAFALGSPLGATARSLITSLVLPTQVGVLYTSIAVLQSLGILVAGPLLANTYRWGMKLGDVWLGFPFLVASGMYLLSLLLVCGVDLSRRPAIMPVEHVDSVDGSDSNDGDDDEESALNE